MCVSKTWFVLCRLVYGQGRRTSQCHRAMASVAKRGEFSRFVGFLAQKGGQIFEDGDLWD